MIPIGRPTTVDSAATKSMISSRVAIWKSPSYFVLRICGSRSRARSVFSSARVKSSVNQPVTASPSMVLRVLRLGELGVVGDVGGAADLVLVARHHHAVLRHHQVRLDEVGTVGDRLAVRGQRVFRPQRRRAAVADHQHPGRERLFTDWRVDGMDGVGHGQRSCGGKGDPA